MATIVMYTEGTLGDHLPFLALGRALTARGHRVRLAINQAMHPYAHRAGLEAVALTDISRGPTHAREYAWAWNHWRDPDHEVQHRAPPGDPERYVAQARQLIALCREADLLIATAIRSLGYVAHSAVGLPWLTVSLNPVTFWQPVAQKERDDIERGEIEAYGSVRDLLAYIFARLGVPQIPPSWSPACLYAPTVLLASSRHFSQPDVHQLRPHSRIEMTGFWLYDDPTWRTWQPDEALSRFCQRQPLVLALSSQPLEDPRRALALHAEAASRLQRPLLVQRGWAGFSEADLPPSADPDQVLFADFLPHDWLFAQAACAIQHGGIGSIARALRHGCPLVVTPYGNDQLYNASRVVGLGVGVAMHPFKMTGDGLVRALQEKVLTREYRQRAEALGAKIRDEHGLETACQLVDAALAHASTTRHTSRPYLQPIRRGGEATPVSTGQPIVIPHILHQILDDPAVRIELAQTAYAVPHWYSTWRPETEALCAERVQIRVLTQGRPSEMTTLRQLEQLQERLPPAADLPLVSCLMVTKNRADLARVAVQCFRQQTYPNRELVIVDDGQDDVLARWIKRLVDARIVYVRLPDANAALGTLRNLAVQRARGAYVAQWDDDDLSGPRRLATQMAAILLLKADGCLLERQQLWWPAQRRMILMDFPQLYTYVYHGANTFPPAHWEAHWRAATKIYEGALYDRRLDALQHRLQVDLAPRSDHHVNPSKEAHDDWKGNGSPDHTNPSNSALASCRSAVSKPSVNQL